MKISKEARKWNGKQDSNDSLNPTESKPFSAIHSELNPNILHFVAFLALKFVFLTTRLVPLRDDLFLFHSARA